MGELRVKGQGSRVKGLERQNISISVFLISILLLFFAGCSGESKKNYRLPAADQVLENFSTFRSERGKKVWELVSTRAKIYEKQNIVEVMDFKVDFYSKDGSKVKAQLSAPRGRIDTLRNDFFTEGDSTLKTVENEVLKTSNLVYKYEQGMIYSDEDVILIRKDSTLKGKGLEATPDLSSIIIKENLVEIKK